MSVLVPGGAYRFVNAKAGNVMDLSGGDNMSVIGYDWHDGDNQKVRSTSSAISSPIKDLMVLCEV